MPAASRTQRPRTCSQNDEAPSSGAGRGFVHLAGQVRRYSNFLASISAEEWGRLVVGCTGTVAR